MGGAALGAANRLASRHSRRPKVIGIRIPADLNPHHLAGKKLVKNIDLKKATKNVDMKKLDKSLDLKDVAMRALGLSRGDDELVDRALRRFNELGLDWQAAQTQSLLSL